ncbi:MAG: prepilin-type N-terminal cleavage/methylation domain-containing protein [Deltaproteobacteria bacterium]|nr:prepilin-type N-terminal cleavage/methylation domain-containing protein [Deltaproteobacteria bacterium]
MKNEKGFTLIELLVVVAIIGILAAIAIPQFSAYRAQAFCARAESDVKNTVTALEAAYADTEDYTTLAAPIQSQGVTVSMDVTATAITTVSGNHPVCTSGTGKGDFVFTGATGVYAWQ